MKENKNTNSEIILRKIMKKIGPFSLFIGIIMLLFGFKDQLFTENFLTEKNSPYILMGVIYTIIGIGAWIYKFIETGNTKDVTKSDNIDFEIKKRFDDLKKEIADVLLTSDNNNIDSEELDRIIKDKITYSLDYTLKEYIESEYSSNIIRATQLRNLESNIRHVQSGINIQIGKLSRSGTINLIIGLFTTLIAIGILIYLILDVQGMSFKTLNAFLIYAIPRLSLAIFIEVFSFFFLKLYKTNLEDVKYFHNESTNIDSKIIALKTSINFEKEDILSEVIRSFAAVERNFILKKGESTVNIEKLKLDNQNTSDIISKITELINHKK